MAEFDRLAELRLLVRISRGVRTTEAQSRLNEAGAIQSETAHSAPDIRTAEKTLGNLDPIGVLVGISNFGDVRCVHIAAFNLLKFLQTINGCKT